ncbi:MAG: S8 family serine peptidase [bacterium]|nr:S8 family serine peptidase [Labilithrix sp.]MCW5893347.1 S8 family serine peptidase [bacterium]
MNGLETHASQTRKLVALACASLVALVACDGTGSPARPRAEVAESDDDDASPPIDDPAAAETTAEPAETPTQLGRACADGVRMPLGNAYTTLVCLPHLDAIHYWEAAAEWSAYDRAPVTVAILDLSFITDHPDIAPSVDITWNFLEAGCTTFDLGKSACRDVAPDVPERVPLPALGEEPIKLVHGTMLAGLIAGRGAPGRGIVGVNPSAKLDLFVRDLETDNLASLRFAVERRVDVISMSWPLGSQGGEKDVPEFRELLETATRQGTVVVMAAGNSRIDVDQRAVYPTRYSTIPGVIAVGSIDEDGDFYAQFSNYGPTYVELAAPGMAASSGGDFAEGRYSVQIGTSYSGPMVAGAVSRVVQYLKTKRAAYSAADVERLVLEGSATSPKLTRYFKDGRRLDMSTLLAHVKATLP